MRQFRRFVTGLGCFTPFEVAGRLLTIGLCLLVAAVSAADLVREPSSLQAAGVLAVSLTVVLGLFAIIVDTGETDPF